MLRDIRRPGIVFYYVAVAAVIYALVGWATWLMSAQLRSLSLQNAIQRTDHTASLFEEHIERSFTTIDWISDAASQAWRTYSNDRNKLQAELARITAREPFALQVSVVDENGIFVASNVSAEGGADLSDRDHIKAHFSKFGPPIYISKPLIGRVSKKPSINITRATREPDGKLSGVIVVSFDPDKLAGFFKSVEIGTGGVVTLLREDGILLARSRQPEIVGEDFSGGRTFRQILNGKSRSGHLEGASAVDGITRLYSYRILDSLPLVVLVGVDKREALRDSTLIDRVAAGWMIALLLAMIIGLLLLQLLRRQESRAQAALTEGVRLEQTISLIRAAFAQAGVEVVIFEPPEKILFSSGQDSAISGTANANEPDSTLALVREFSANPVLDKLQFSRSFTTSDGKRQIYSWVLVPASWISKAAMVAVGFDRTELEEREQALYQKARLTTMGEMLTSLSHEIAQPLTAINFAAGTISQNGQSGENISGSIELMTAAVARVKAIVDRMKMFGRLEPAHELTEFDVHECLESVRALTQNELDLAQIKLRTSVPPETNALGDALLFEQVLLNLVLNARDSLKSLPEAGSERRAIEISRCELDPEHTVLEVRDYGSGIPKQLHARIFDPFFSTKPTGTGLGLALSFGIMRDMGGSIELIDSEVGACFHLTLRAAEAMLPLPAPIERQRVSAP